MTDLADTAVDYVIESFRAIEAGDMAAFERCYVPGATVWHNYDEIEQDIYAAMKALQFLNENSTRIEYQDQTIVATGDLRFIQHVLSADLLNGKVLRLPAMMKMEVVDDGRIIRVEEYFDSRATDCLFGPQ